VRQTLLLFCVSAFLKLRSAAVELYLKAMPDIEKDTATPEDEVLPPKSGLQPSTLDFNGRKAYKNQLCILLSTSCTLKNAFAPRDQYIG